jgi:hypothetical protein
VRRQRQKKRQKGAVPSHVAGVSVRTLRCPAAPFEDLRVGDARDPRDFKTTLFAFFYFFSTGDGDLFSFEWATETFVVSLRVEQARSSTKRAVTRLLLPVCVAPAGRHVAARRAAPARFRFKVASSAADP